MQELFRETTLGISLQNSLSKLTKDAIITSDQAKEILERFDDLVPVFFKNQNSHVYFRGKLDSYQNIENIWILFFKKLELRSTKLLKKDLVNVKIISIS